MNDSIRDRDIFVRLGRDGVRSRRDPLWCTYLPQPGKDDVSVAYSIGRSVGPAVARNRLRRRLRMIIRSTEMPAGWWLIGARPGSVELAFEELQDRIAHFAVAMSPSGLAR